MSRIPELTTKDADGVALWFAKMEKAGLFFHPEDDPAEIINGAREFLFSRAECSEIRDIQELYFEITDGDPCAIAMAVLDMTEGTTDVDEFTAKYPTAAEFIKGVRNA